MSEKKPFQVDAKDGKIELNYDGNLDGENSIELKIHISEVVAEALKQGKEVEGKQMFDYKFDLTGKLTLSADTDADGEASVELAVYIGEALEEADLLGGSKE